MSGSADTVYRVLTVYDADGSKAKHEVGMLVVVFDHLLSLMDRAKEMLGSVLELSSAAENARISIAGLMSAGGFPGTSNFQTSMAMSAEIMKQMRKDARDLPGEFEDLEKIFQFSLLGGGQAGKSVNEVEAMSAKLMSVTKSLGIASEFAGREFAELMEGRASSRVTLFAKLRNNMGVKDMDAAKFNAMSAPERWQAIEKALSSFGPMIAEYSKSWDAISSTSSDYLKTVIRVGSMGLFERLKSTLDGVNKWFEANQPKIESIATAIGDGVAAAIEWLGGVIGTYGPVVWSFLEGVWTVGAAAFGTLKEIVLSAAEVLSGAFPDSAGGAANALGEVVGVGLLIYGVVTAVSILTSVFVSLLSVAAGGAILLVNPFVLAGVAVTALGAGILIVISYWEDLKSSLADAMDSDVMRGLMKATGVIPADATAADMEEGIGNASRHSIEDTYRRGQELRKKYGDDGVGAHVKDMFGYDPAAPAGQRADYGPKWDPVAQLLAQRPPSKHEKANMNVTVNLTQTINTDEGSDRVTIRTTKAIKDALERPIQSFNSRVLR